MNYMLSRMSFEVKWRRQVKFCIPKVLFAVMVNGGSSSFFSVSRGFRQGDSLSPLFFIVVMKVLNKMMVKAREQNLFKGLYVSRVIEGRR